MSGTLARSLGALGDAIGGTANVNFDSNTLFVDGISNAVRVVSTTTTGNSRLDVDLGITARTEAASGTSPFLQLFNGNASSNLKTWRIGGTSAGALTVETINDAYNSSTQRMLIDSSGNFGFNSGYGSVATAYGCRAWVNFNGTGVVAIRASGNVSSITDTNVGRYTVNFTNAMPDANYCVALGGDNITGVGNAVLNTDGTYNTSGISISLTDTTNTYRDDNFVNVAIFR